MAISAMAFLLGACAATPNDEPKFGAIESIPAPHCGPAFAFLNARRLDDGSERNLSFLHGSARAYVPVGTYEVVGECFAWTEIDPATSPCRPTVVESYPLLLEVEHGYRYLFRCSREGDQGVLYVEQRSLSAR